GIDHETHQAEGFTNYTVFSVWDTYRALHPLLTLLDPDLATDIVKSFLAHYSQSPHGMLPVWSHNGNENWCMIGYHGVSVVADALEKGLLKGREAQAVEAMLSSSNVAYYDFTDIYKKIGYVPVDKSANGVSVTLENAYEDWTVFNTLFHNGRKTEASLYRQRALNYRNVFDPRIGFARARYSDGSWKEPYSLLSTYGEGFIEGNGWNYSFYVPHDVFGLIRQMGGDAAFVAKLDTLFTMHIPDAFFAQTEDVTREGMLGGYVQGNEPSHHIPYLYMWTSQPWKTQYWVREIMNKMYRNHMDGLCGNDDCGQMSAWYIFSAMGFYPVCPGSGQYVIGAPYMPYLKLHLGNGSVLEIKAPKVSDKNRYIQSVTWNGAAWDKAYLTHRQLSGGGVLEFVMGPKPNTKLFRNKADKPYSLTE
ncbi:MAG: glycoside hydrolase family 92 protein, partial [Bacteroidales bacterium]|nr:glycoside hydrolase family 92 protein [Bacteroidales bacterium]